MDGINILNFGLYPDKYQSSGYFNFSCKLDKTLSIDIDDLYYKNSYNKNDKLMIKIYGVGYKIIRFKDGTLNVVL